MTTGPPPGGAAAAVAHGLTLDEHARILAILGREPNLVELGLFAVMWSEHCSYKSSRIHLQTLPTEGPQVLQGPGENAGAVDVGDGLAAVFKIESHNHPSFIEPYQGAATGVGGIIRDIFTMGARPIALLDALRFGPPDTPATRRLIHGVVAGIAGYGNSIGIPTIGGETGFDPCYAGNPLVNVFCLGVAPASALVTGQAAGVGNPVYYVGAKTGRDGIHGATMASAEFDDASAEKRPNVQVGDPFMEKLLLEACLEVLPTGALVGLQDMGAAGLTCATAEMAARGGTGIEIDVGRVPQREAGMTPYEIMLSESQERMLFVVRAGREAEVDRVFAAWDLHAVRIGTVTGDGRLRVRRGGAVVADVPTRALVDEAPRHDRPQRPPPDLAARQTVDLAALPGAGTPEAVFLRLLAAPGLASTRWIVRQYDHMVRTATIAPAGAGAAAVRLKGTARALACSVDGNGRQSWLDPERAAMLAVAESARNVACAGARPVGLTNCLNFGNPERPEIMWAFAATVRGIGTACRALALPVTGGNVSFYNETDGRAIRPTPIIGVVGVIDDARRVVTRTFQAGGAAVLLLGPPGAGSLGGSAWLEIIHGMVRGPLPAIDFAAERAVQALVAALAADGRLLSANDAADGGLAAAIAEGCVDTDGIGCDVTLPAAPAAAGGPAAALYGEAPSRIVVSVRAAEADLVLAQAAAAGVPARRIGTTGGSRLRMAVEDGPVVDVPLAEAAQAWAAGLERRLDPPAA